MERKGMTSFLIAECKVRAGPVKPNVATTDCSQHTVKLEGNSTVTQLTRVVLKLQSDTTQVTHPQLYGGFLHWFLSSFHSLYKVGRNGIIVFKGFNNIKKSYLQWGLT